MAWVVNVQIDADKTNVGTATAVFTDTDSTTFTVSQRATMTAANGTAFVNAAISARNSWQTAKTREGNSRTTLINDFGAAVPAETATAASANSASVILGGVA